MRAQIYTLFIGALLAVTPVWAVNIPRLFNANFDKCAIEGVPCEWLIQGPVKADNENGIQTLSEIPPGVEVQMYQTVNLCTPGSGYKATLHIKEILTADTQVRIGLDPSDGEDPEQTVWAASQVPEIISVECMATGNNCRVLIGISNPSREAAASLDGVSFIELTSVSSLGPQPPSADPAIRAEAQESLVNALDLMDKRIQYPQAERLLLAITQDHPDARPEAARALVELQRVRHAYQPDIYDMPRKEWENYLGMPYLRTALRQYPDQPEACALARTRMGQHYLGFQLIPQAFEFLDSVIEDYPGTEAFWWSKTFMVNALLWSGNPTAASQVLTEIEGAYEKGEANLHQKAWAEYLYHGQRIASDWSTDVYEARLTYYDKVWDQYKDTYPEIAIRAKLAKAWAAEHEKEYYRSIEDYRDMLNIITTDRSHMGPPRLCLSRILLNRGWLPEHRADAMQLLQEVAASPLASTRMHNEVQTQIETYSTPGIYGAVAWTTPEFRVNLLKNGDFEALPDQGEDASKYNYHLWRFDVLPNWPSCDWTDKAPGSGLGKQTPAWSSVNGGLLRGNLTHNAIIVSGSTPFRAGFWFAADAWDGGEIDGVRYKLTLRFMDGFNKPLGEIVSDPAWANLGPKVWQELALTGVTPENACYAEFIIYMDVTGEGQHNTAITEATLILGENGQ